MANSSTKTEQGGVIVSADKTVRVNAGSPPRPPPPPSRPTSSPPRRRRSTSARPPRIHLRRKFITNVPIGRNFGDVIEKAPGAFLDRSGNVSIGGATGLENIYLVNGLNVTGSRTATSTATPPASAAAPTSRSSSSTRSRQHRRLQRRVRRRDGRRGQRRHQVGHQRAARQRVRLLVAVLAGRRSQRRQPVGGSSRLRKPDFDNSVGAEVGGPIIKNKLFFWVGFAPRITDTHVLRLTYAVQEDPNHPGQPLLKATGCLSRRRPTGPRASPRRAGPTTTPGRSTGSRCPTTG